MTSLGLSLPSYDPSRGKKDVDFAVNFAFRRFYRRSATRFLYTSRDSTLIGLSRREKCPAHSRVSHRSRLTDAHYTVLRRIVTYRVNRSFDKTLIKLIN